MAQAAAQLAQVQASESPGKLDASQLNQTAWRHAEQLPCTVSIEVPIQKFTLKNLLALERGYVLSSQHPTTSALPLRINGELISWCEFEVLGSRLAVRLTELA